MGSPLLSQCVPLFPAVYRLGLSATPKRKDGADRVGFWHIGPIMVTSKAKALECTVYVKRFRSRTPLWGNNAIVRAKCLSQDKQRNLELVSLIQRTYRAGRNILVIGKFVDHLQNLMELCVQYGIPHSDMGQYTGQRFIRQKVLTPEGMKVKTVRKVNISNREYARVKAESRIIFATYGVFREGIDVPRLDCGIDVLPQSDAEQVIGRIRRPMEGKPSPYWITLVDENCVFSQQMFTNRLKDYAKTGCRVVESPSI